MAISNCLFSSILEILAEFPAECILAKYKCSFINMWIGCHL